MSLLGDIVGGGLGFLVGGPFGAALGAGLGSAATGGNLKQDILAAGGSYLGGLGLTPGGFSALAPNLGTLPAVASGEPFGQALLQNTAEVAGVNAFPGASGFSSLTSGFPDITSYFSQLAGLGGAGTAGTGITAANLGGSSLGLGGSIGAGADVGALGATDYSLAGGLPQAGTGLGIQGAPSFTSQLSSLGGLGGGAGGVNYSLLGGGGAGAGGGGFLGSTAGNYLKTGLGALQLAGGLQSYQAGQQRLGQQQQYAKQLQALMANPSSVQGLPGYQAGLQAVQRSQAAQGYQGSGNMAAALAGYGGQAYQQQLANLAQLQGQSAPVSSPLSALTGAGLGAYGIGSGLSGLGYI